jgi:hypothetical protein
MEFHFLQDGELIENLAQEFTDLRSDISSRISRLERDLEAVCEAEMSSEEDSSPLPQIAVHESIQVRVTRGPFLTMPLGKEDVSAEKVSKRS